MRAVEVPHVLHEAIASELHACEETIHVPRRAQGIALVPSAVAGRQDTAEGLVAAVVAVDQVGAAVDAVDVGASCGMKVGGCHEQQGQGQEGGQKQFLHFKSPLRVEGPNKVYPAKAYVAGKRLKAMLNECLGSITRF